MAGLCSRHASHCAPTPAAPISLPEGTTAYASLNEGGLRSMFQTDPRQQGGVSAGVARLWQGRSGGTDAVRPEPARAAPTYFNMRKTSIYGGSNEIQRNIISKAELGL